MKEFLKQNGFKPWCGDYLFEMGTKRIFARFKPRNKSQLELLEKKYKDVSPELLDFYSKYNGASYTLQGRSRNIDEAKICSLNEMFDKFKEEAIPFPEMLNISEYNQSFDLQSFYLKKEHPFIGKLYSKEKFEEFDTCEDLNNANVIRRVKKIATKKQIRVNILIKELEKHFMESSVHQEKLKNIVSNFNLRL